MKSIAGPLYEGWNYTRIVAKCSHCGWRSEPCESKTAADRRFNGHWCRRAPSSLPSQERSDG